MLSNLKWSFLINKNFVLKYYNAQLIGRKSNLIKISEIKETRNDSKTYCDKLTFCVSSDFLFEKCDIL